MATYNGIIAFANVPTCSYANKKNGIRIKSQNNFRNSEEVYILRTKKGGKTNSYPCASVSSQCYGAIYSVRTNIKEGKSILKSTGTLSQTNSPREPFDHTFAEINNKV